ncbi:MAG TPA: substrate-binding domain-containing protein [Candidatus Dormibacteraeota bacterium]|nr:substrate-binding domain-containing protein [Candidatus Dormibacteraeota bacterium]
MKKLRFLVSLMTSSNDYQQAQESAAAETSRRLGVEANVIYAENDTITQSTQLLTAIQSAPELRPDAILINPVGGSGLPQVARAATSAGIGWVVLNRKAHYISELRRNSRAPIFGVSPDQIEIGRLQARQIAALLPNGGSVLYIQGPSDNKTAEERTAGMQQNKPATIQVTMLRGQWTENSAEKTITSWLQLATSRRARFDLVACHNDGMAMGARKAFAAQSDAEREKWLRLPFIGIDGLPHTGQSWVRGGKLTATIVMPLTVPLALEMLVKAIRTGTTPAELKLIDSMSFPTIDALASVGVGAN